MILGKIDMATWLMGKTYPIAAMDQAARAAAIFTGSQFHGSSSSIFCAGWSFMRASTSASQGWGSMSFIFAVYADCQTMPNDFVFPRIWWDRHVIGSA